MHDRLKHFESPPLLEQLRHWARELGFVRLGVSGIDLEQAGAGLQHWLDRQYHGEMDYMARHGSKRYRPAELQPGTLSVISVAMDYLPAEAADPWQVLEDPGLGYVSRYALGRDYHKLMRKRLQQLAERIAQHIQPHGFRVFVDSAPVMEKPIAAQAGLGWQGKHSNLLSREGSWFFLGEIYTDLPLPVDQAGENHCGRCSACIEICPTQAIVAPYVVDARRCISYLTIEHKGSIPLEFRPAIGNRIYGCDDCQLVCPWNRFAQPTTEQDYLPRHRLDQSPLLELFAWSETDFLQRMEGSPIRRIGYLSWLRNIAIALGNAPYDAAVLSALARRENDPSALLREHVHWAQAQQLSKQR
ncbi:MAG: tRNA epoxyqueuosine(34) reductase QueG [Chromatiales bacterium]|nr:tRNA epoxyqueuosine(34) reductase QueG [Chromatiales bacterium]